MNKKSKRLPAPRRRGNQDGLPHISIIIRGLREEQGWVQEAAAEKLKISRAALARIEQGQLGVSAKTLEGILVFYGMTLSAVALAVDAESEYAKKKSLSADDFPEW